MTIAYGINLGRINNLTFRIFHRILMIRATQNSQIISRIKLNTTKKIACYRKISYIIHYN